MRWSRVATGCFWCIHIYPISNYVTSWRWNPISRQLARRSNEHSICDGVHFTTIKPMKVGRNNVIVITRSRARIAFVGIRQIYFENVLNACKLLCVRMFRRCTLSVRILDLHNWNICMCAQWVIMVNASFTAHVRRFLVSRVSYLSKCNPRLIEFISNLGKYEYVYCVS